MDDGYTLTGHPELDLLIALVVAVAVAALAHDLANAALRRIFRHRRVPALFLAHARAPGRWVVVTAAALFVLESASPGPRHAAAITHAATLALILCATWLVASLVDGLVEAVIALHPSDVSDNLHARRLRTQARVLGRTLKLFAVVFGIAAALVTFPGVRQLGATLFASAGLAGLAAGLAARPVLGNLIAGLQIAFTQPIRIDDVVVVAGEWGRIEEITSAYVVVKVWDERRLVVPLQWFIENPFQNWTRTSSQVVGTVFFWADYSLPVEEARQEFLRLCREAPEWDRRVAALQVTELGERAMQLRGLASSADAGANWDLRCRLREAMVDYVARRHPGALPRVRAEARLGRREAPGPVAADGPP